MIVLILLIAGVVLLPEHTRLRKPNANKATTAQPIATEKAPQPTTAPEVVAPKVVAPEVILESLQKGDFNRAQELLQNMPEQPGKTRLQAMLNTPLGVDVKFQYQIATGEPSIPYSIQAPELRRLTLSYKDNYRLLISVSFDKTYLYVFQKDHYGQITRLFPDPVWSKVDNPIRDGVTYRIPPGEKEWLYLDELPHTRGNPVSETLFIVASPWKAEDIEDLYGEIYRSTSQASRKRLIEQLLGRLRLRQEMGLNAVYHNEFSFHHEG